MSTQIILKYPLVFFVALMVTYFLVPVMEKFAQMVGMIDQPGDRRVHKKPVPRSGGIAVFIGFHAACAVLLLLPWVPFDGKLDVVWWKHFLLVSLVLFVVGVIDDIWGVRALFKLVGQLGAAVLAFWFDMRFGNLLGLELPVLLDLAMTIFWIVFFINAFNLIDGLDGLAAGLAAIASAGIAGSLALRHLPGDTLVTIALTGSCLAFLRFNFHPARIFLGDTGSMFLGLTLALIALQTGSKGPTVASLGVPVLAAGIPFFDTILAVWRRSVRGISNRLLGGEQSNHVMHADMEHLHHRLIKRGLSQPRVAISLYVVNATLVTIGLMSMVFKAQMIAIYLVAFVVAVYIIVKHLARVELWDSGQAILHGLHQPAPRVIIVLCHPVLDILLLSTAFLVSLLLCGGGFEELSIKQEFVHRLPLWVAIPFITIASVRTYSRVWSRARVSEFAVLGVALCVGVILALALSSVFEVGYFHGKLRLAVMFFGLSVPMLTGNRAFIRTVQDAMAVMRHHPGSDDGEPMNVLVYGAGYRCTLYLRAKSFVNPVERQHTHVVGLIDDDRNLLKRWVHGYQVLGSATDLPQLIEQNSVKEIIIVASLTDSAKSKVLHAAREKGVRLIEWKAEESIIHDASEIAVDHGDSEGALGESYQAKPKD